MTRYKYYILLVAGFVVSFAGAYAGISVWFWNITKSCHTAFWYW